MKERKGTYRDIRVSLVGEDVETGDLVEVVVGDLVDISVVQGNRFAGRVSDYDSKCLQIDTSSLYRGSKRIISLADIIGLRIKRGDAEL